MGNFLKDIAVLLFSAGEEIEQKADDFKQKRDERYKEFEEKIQQKKETMKTKLDEEVEKAKQNLKDFSGKLGFVSKDEFNDLKKKIDELGEKLDKIIK